MYIHIHIYLFIYVHSLYMHIRVYMCICIWITHLSKDSVMSLKTQRHQLQATRLLDHGHAVLV